MKAFVRVTSVSFVLCCCFIISVFGQEAESKVLWNKVVGNWDVNSGGQLFADDSGLVIYGNSYIERSKYGFGTFNATQLHQFFRVNTSGNITEDFQVPSLGIESTKGMFRDSLKNYYIFSTGSLCGVSNHNEHYLIDGHTLARDFAVSKLDKHFNILWTQCMGSSGAEAIHTVLKVSEELFLIVGTTDGRFLDGDVDVQLYGKDDVWMVWVNSDGELVTQNSWGTKDADAPSTVAYANGLIALTQTIHMPYGAPTRDDIVLLNSKGKEIYRQSDTLGVQYPWVFPMKDSTIIAFDQVTSEFNNDNYDQVMYHVDLKNHVAEKIATFGSPYLNDLGYIRYNPQSNIFTMENRATVKPYNEELAYELSQTDPFYNGNHTVILEIDAEGNILKESVIKENRKDSLVMDGYTYKLRFASQRTDRETYYYGSPIHSSPPDYMLTKIGVPVSPRSSVSHKELVVSPIPATDKLTVENIPAGNVELGIYAADGKELLRAKSEGATSLQISINSFSTGVYYVRAIDTEYPAVKVLIE